MATIVSTCFFQERFLVAAAVVVGHAGVVGQDAVAQLGRSARGLVHVLAGDAVDDPRFAAVPVQHLADLPQPVGAPLDLVDQVGPVERADQELPVAQLQLLGDVLPHLVRRRGRVGVDADAGERLLQDPQLAVFGPEVVPPRADAVGLVDRQQRDPRGRRNSQRALRQQPLGRHVQQPQPARRTSSATRRRSAADSVLLANAAGTPQVRRASTWSFISEISGETTTASPQAQGRGLEAQRLAAAGRQHDHRIAPCSTQLIASACSGRKLSKPQ